MPYHDNYDEISELDLSTGKMRTIFRAPDGAKISSFAVSPDGKRIALGYAAPPDKGQLNLGNTDLYWMPYDGSQPPQPILMRKTSGESFFRPAWSPDGQSLFYSHFFMVNADAQPYKYQVERIAIGGQPQVLAKDALWPVLPKDGSQLAYLSYDPVKGGNQLYISQPDGSAPKATMDLNTFPAVDAHLYLADNKSLLFSSVNPVSSYSPSWLDRLMGVQIASAHNAPSDWYKVDGSGAKPQRVTNLNDTGLDGALAPDGKSIAFIAGSGLYVMNADGTNIRHLSDQSLVNNIDWLP